MSSQCWNVLNVPGECSLRSTVLVLRKVDQRGLSAAAKKWECLRRAESWRWKTCLVGPTRMRTLLWSFVCRLSCRGEGMSAGRGMFSGWMGWAISMVWLLEGVVTLVVRKSVCVSFDIKPSIASSSVFVESNDIEDIIEMVAPSKSSWHCLVLF